MTTQIQPALQLPAIIQQILDDDSHPHYYYCTRFMERVHHYQETHSHFVLSELLGFISASSYLITFEFYQLLSSFLDTVLLYAKPQIENMTELAPPLDDSVIVVHQGATISATLFCYQCDKQVSYLFPDSRCKDCTRLTPDEVGVICEAVS